MNSAHQNHNAFLYHNGIQETLEKEKSLFREVSLITVCVYLLLDASCVWIPSLTLYSMVGQDGNEPKKLDTNIRQLPGHEFGIEPDSCLLILP